MKGRILILCVLIYEISCAAKGATWSEQQNQQWWIPSKDASKGGSKGGSTPSPTPPTPPTPSGVVPPNPTLPSPTLPSPSKPAILVPVDCELSEWSSWKACDKSCGGGLLTRTREVITPAQNGGKCDPLSDNRPCNVDVPCPVDCVMGAWGDFSACSTTCGNGLQVRRRTIVKPSSNGGVECTATEEKKTCNVGPCPVDCVMGEWGDWSVCTKSCGTGQTTRVRSIIVASANGGKDCLVTSESKTCKEQPCPVDCELSEWSSWSACDKTCGGGLTKRSRGVVTQPANDGAACQNLLESRPCNVDVQCPIDCVVGTWTPWGECSTTCGTGTRSRTRPVSVVPQFGGAECPITVESGSCNTSPCPVDCIVGDWESWSSCDSTCGEGKQSRTRKVVTQPAFGGASCPETTEVKTCQSIPCPIDCVVGDWGSWTPCDATCGTGKRSRARPTTVNPLYNGKACPSTLESESCNTQPCPVDCVLSEWGSWTECDATCGGGVSTRSRTVVTPTAFGGETCLSTQDARACNTLPCPVPCEMSDWSVWSACSKTCGGGISQRSRKINVDAAFGAPPCEETLQQEPCNIDPCPIDCVLGSWSEFSPCSEPCGSGLTFRSRPVTTPALYGGKVCESTRQENVCNTQPCPVDCKVGTWSDWTACTVTCGGGQSTRTRSVTQAAANGGASCPATTETIACNVSPCPIDCVVGAWAEWSACSVSCGKGTQTRSRKITVQSAYGGVACPVTVDEQSCNTQPCPIDCVLGDWSEFDACEVSCGGGKRARTRDIVVAPQFGGQECAITKDFEDCNTQPCPIDCVLGEWFSWSECDKSCGSGNSRRSRPVFVTQQFEGKPCGATEETRICNQQPCPVDCVLSDWSSWSECDVSCGGGSTTRTRTVSVAAQFGGQTCGETTQKESCNIQPCPVDCVMGDWTGWNDCDVSCGGGSQQRSRRIFVDSQYGGKACPAGVENQACNVQNCPIDCVLDAWTEWSECSKTCGGGSQSRSRRAVTLPLFGGKECEATAETQDCNTQPCPIDCVMTAWTEWSSCDLTCGGGKRQRTREITVESKYGGVPCGALLDIEDCNTQPCPIDCIMAEWTQWEVCDKSCGGGKQKRSRSILVQPAFGGIVCAETENVRECNAEPCPIDCVLSDWSAWSVCDQTCGGGNRFRNRTVSVQDQFGGKPCGRLNEIEDCNVQPCPIDCVLSTWAEWSSCDKTCGGGSRQRTRSVLISTDFGGQQCQATTEVEACNSQPCPIDCILGVWTAFSKCSEPCGRGSSIRTRPVLTNPAYGGALCDATQEIIVCNSQPCPVDCVVDPWTVWSDCDKTCGGGISKRSRSVKVPADYGGEPCPLTSETRVCNIQPCPIDCVLGPWGTWSNCDKTCGTGASFRSRSVSVQPANGGKACEATTDKQACNTQPCPIDCVMGDWTSWQLCDKTCGAGTQRRTRGIIVATAFGGKQCSATSETQQCNTQPCPIDCILSVWGEWSKCDKSCGGGITTRTRYIQTAPLYSGKECGETVEKRACNVQPCPVDCVVGDWTTWGSCTVSCGGGRQTRSRSIQVSPEFGGIACPVTREIQACNTQACPIDCVVSRFTRWSECDKTCGGGIRKRSREIRVAAQFGGQACPATEQTRSCNEAPCPIDCVMSTWTEWTVCDRSCGSGRQSRTRKVVTSPNYGGKLCGATSDVQKCNTQPCPVDCVLTSFFPWGFCDKKCGGGQRKRIRLVLLPALFGGKECEATTEMVPCNTHPCPVDCQVSEWTEYSTCDKSCGIGHQRSTRKVLVEPKFGGEECPELSRIRHCNFLPCPVDCVLSDWTEWSVCDEICGGGKQTRTRKINVPSAWGGKVCDVTREQKVCNTQACPVNCVMGLWSRWSDCSKTCGGGIARRTRDVIVTAKNGGKACPGSEETRTCNVQPCPIDCVMDKWTEWSACSKTCGGGTSVRTRNVVTVPANGGKECGFTRDVNFCNVNFCPVDCVLSDWTEWSKCDKTCGGGKSQRTRKVTTIPKFGGKPCGVLEEVTTCNVQPCPVDCVVSPWTQWSACTKTCGTGSETRSREIRITGMYGGVPCPATVESRSCNVDPCPIDCVVSSWSEWSVCDRTCDGGKSVRTRTVVTSPFRGRPCPVLSEELTCNTQPCSVDCVVSAWDTWTACSLSCGGGIRTRSRKILIPSLGSGKVCPSTNEKESCNIQPCPIDCIMGSWTGWSACSRDCDGGTQVRTRPVLTPNKHGGRTCLDTQESQRCNTQPCPIDCVMSQWGSWSRCTTTCGGGRQTRSRAITVTPRYGGKSCDETQEVHVCNPQQCPVDCVVSTWSDWTPCSKSCDGGSRQRTRKVVIDSIYGGAACPDLVEVSTCNTQPCPVNCVLADWSAWSDCSEECGSGKRFRTRLVKVAPKNGGKGCDVTQEVQVCNTQACPPCNIGEWSDWSQCDKTCGGGEMTRTRDVSRRLWFAFWVSCPDKFETRDCNINPCPIDCVMGWWSSWSSCDKDCGSGVKTRTRRVLRGDSFGGQPCGVTVESTACNTQECPIDCLMAPWSSWTECDRTCGGGYQTRSRTIQRPARNGGEPCDVTFDRQACNVRACPVDCKLSAWGSWSACSKSCNGGVSSRTRSVINAPANGGSACDATVETTTCNVQPCAVDCVVSDWGVWSQCTVNCGGGSTTRSRTVVTPASSGGRSCPGLTETSTCNTKPCAVDCVMGSWGSWSSCDKTCGGGTTSRTRSIVTLPANGGAACDITQEVRTCSEQACPLDCSMSAWSAWSKCDKPCSGGSSIRVRNVLRPASNGGVACGVTQEQTACNTQPCPIDCVLGQWTQWTACSQSCGGGVQSRTRPITTAPSADGVACEVTQQIQACNSNLCPVDCVLSEWNEWGACDKQCGGGIQRRTRTVYTASANGGAECGATEATRSCNEQACQVDCVMSAWGAFSECSRQCGFGQMTRVRSVVTPPSEGGRPCGVTWEAVACNTQSCSSNKGGGKGSKTNGFGGDVWGQSGQQFGQAKGLVETNSNGANNSNGSVVGLVAGVMIGCVVVVGVLVFRRRRTTPVADSVYREL